MQGSPETHALILAGPVSKAVVGQKELLRAGRRLGCLAAAWTVAQALEWRPDVVLGHLAEIPTSIRLDWQQRGTQFILLPSAYEYSELEFALNFTITTGARDILLLGLLSSRLAERLSRLFLLARPEWGAAKIAFVHGQERGYVLRHGESVSLQVTPQDRITLIPLSPTVTEITVRGAAPLLRGATLEFGTTQELVPVERPVQVWVGAGRLLLIHEHPLS